MRKDFIEMWKDREFCHCHPRMNATFFWSIFTLWNSLSHKKWKGTYMSKILLVEGKNGCWKAKERNMNEVWDLFCPDPLEKYDVGSVR